MGKAVDSCLSCTSVRWSEFYSFPVPIFSQDEEEFEYG